MAMLNILVPTDFSDLSKVAIRYALAMAKKMKGKVSLLHVIETSQHSTGNRLRLDSLIRELVHIAEEDFEQLVSEIKDSDKSPGAIKHKIEQGSSFISVVSKYAKNSRTNLIVMGTHGASGLRKVVMGSNTAAMLEQSKIPVLAVPPQAEFKSLRSIVYATDLLNTQKELKKLLTIVGKEKPIIHIIHVATDRSTATIAETKIDKVVSKVGYKNAIVRVLINKNPVPAISEYVRKINIDMLSMFPHQYSFFQKLVKPSVTKQLSYINTAPLLAFKG